MSGLAPFSGFAQIVDARVLARAQRGDMQAFAALYAQFGKPCYGLGLRLTGNAAQAEDLVQEVFLKLIETIRSYRGDAPFGAWLKRMTANAAIDQLRRNKRFVDADPEAMFAGPETEADPAQELDAVSLLQRLPPRARAIVVLHELEGYTHTEIAKLFGQSESYSKSIVARGLQRLHAAVATPQAET
ncbi:MAG: sigma-70 family RNA polymerase sigma factor [Proteobacteria bacterium]|uniref:RNA polymerase sigma factor n=1 Tax=Rudaea sp. TaxID=2136325 RepID=UPI0032208D3C|nr:sigma-70 family RNA polymerase sigma factor [Pseudomonadota bacterium]